MINLVQSEHSREFLVSECIDNFIDGLIGPLFKWLFYL